MNLKKILAVVATAAALAVPLAAHHSFAAEYDEKAPVKITGTLTKVDWINPHSWIFVDVKDPATGKIASWRCETAPPNGMIRRGIYKTSFPIGSEVEVNGYRAKDGSNTMNAQQATIGGKSLFTGGSGPGSDAAKAKGDSK